MVLLLPAVPLLAVAACGAGGQQDAGRRTQARVSPDGAVWVRADIYAEMCGAKAEVQQGGELIVICIGERCVPLRSPLEARVIDGKLFARADRLMQVLGAAPAPATGTGLRSGDLAPDFTLTSLGGSPVRLSDFRGEKVLVFAWASW